MDLRVNNGARCVVALSVRTPSERAKNGNLAKVISPAIKRLCLYYSRAGFVPSSVRRRLYFGKAFAPVAHSRTPPYYHCRSSHVRRRRATSGALHSAALAAAKRRAERRRLSRSQTS